MATELLRTGFTQLFEQSATPSTFLTRLFSIKPGGVFRGEKVTIDIVRSGREVALPVEANSSPRMNDFSAFTTKEYTPPTYDEAASMNINEAYNRLAGVDPYSAIGISYQGQMMTQLIRNFNLLNDKLSRSVEVQASQVMQTGAISILDPASNELFAINYFPKATHFPTVAVNWGTASEDPIGDLQSLANVIQQDGAVTPNIIIPGAGALRNLLNNAEVIEQLNNRRKEMGTINPQLRDSGAVFYGTIWVGTFEFEIWAYPDTFTNPVGGAQKKYVDDDKVIMTSSRTRLDMLVAQVPPPVRINGGGEIVSVPMLPERITSANRNFDLMPNLYTDASGTNVIGQLKTRPLLAPTQIDGYGCLDTQI